MSVWSALTLIATRPETAMLGVALGLAFIALGLSLGRKGAA